MKLLKLCVPEALLLLPGCCGAVTESAVRRGVSVSAGITILAGLAVLLVITADIIIDAMTENRKRKGEGR